MIINIQHHGIQFQFDTYTNDYPRTMNIKWYRDDALILENDYTLDSADYFAEQVATAYNKVVITISNMTKADRFLKIFNINDGLIRTFFNEELENVEIIEDLNVNSEEIAINEASISLIPQTTAGIFFQRTLPFKVYRDETLYGNFFITSSTSNTNKTKYKINTADYISVLDNQTYLGGMYNEVTVASLIADIMGDVPYRLETALGNKTISGYLPISTRREALAQVAFACLGMVDTSRSEVIEIKSLPTTILRTIQPSEIISIQTTQENVTTQYTLNVQQYYQGRGTSSDDIFSGRLRGTQYITFNEPMYNLNAENATITSQSVNWCILNADSNFASLTGKKYQSSVKTYEKQNSIVVSTDVQKVQTFETSLVWDSEALINYLPFIEYRVKAKFLMNNSKVGDLVSIDGHTARITRLTYDLKQSNIYCDAELEAYYE